MPVIINSPNGNKLSIGEAKYDYEYPDGLDLRPSSELHEKLKTEIVRRIQDSRSVMQKRYPTWKKADRTLTFYIPLDEIEKELKKKDERRPVSIVMPMSYAIRETFMTYLIAIFLKDPLIAYSGVGPEDVVGATLLEKVIAQQCVHNKIDMGLVTLMSNGVSYGVGPASVGWDVTWRKKRVAVPRNLYNDAAGMEYVPIDGVAFEGNTLNPIDPYVYYPDPNVSAENIQNAEYIGWIVRENKMSLLSRERDGDEELFNCKYINHIQGLSSSSRSVTQGREQRSDLVRRDDMSIYAYGSTNPTDTIYMYWNLIPKDWGLGDSEYPEKWFFMVVGDQIIVQAKPLGLDHNMYPMVCAAPEFDGFSAAPIATMQSVAGLQEFVDFMISNHITNRRKLLNDMLVVDPSLVNMKDLANPSPGKLIRMRRSAWGRGVKDAVVQLNIADITQNSVPEISSVMELMQRVSGAIDSVQGIPSGGERKSAAEYQGLSRAAVSRLEKMSRIIGMQVMRDLGYMFASHTQQMMTKATYVKAIGEWGFELEKEFGPALNGQRYPVNLEDIMVDFDVVAEYGTMPGSQDPNTWKDILQMIGTSPILSSQLDAQRVFAHFARLSGAKEISSFMVTQGGIRPQVVSDTHAMAQANAGNAITPEEMASAYPGAS